MKKMLVKKILCILDMIEIHGIDHNDLFSALETELDQNEIIYEKQDVLVLLAYLFDHHFLKDTTRGIDLSPSATIYAKADSHSRVEALSLFECTYQLPSYRQKWIHIFHHGIHIKQLTDYFDSIYASLLLETNLFHQEQDQLMIQKEYADDLAAIIAEYDEERTIPLLLSTTLCVYYTCSIVAHDNKKIEYKNQDQPLVSYPHLDTILQIIPHKGVPVERSETKALQSFYKDTLFHECDHACPLCQIDIPQMLIASHIKPFRDCAHIYEAIDHNNGLLLCRNHDFLFDQGYISFSDDGNILIAQALYDKTSLSAYQIKKETRLTNTLLTKERKLFLKYHRDNIFKG